jgi:4-hydroxy-tetrahydrodipicolinate reductase
MKVAIAGQSGRMGRIIRQELESGAWTDLTYGTGTVRGDDPVRLLDGDIIIDFSSPDATRTHIALAAQHHKPIIIGTTGLSATDQDALRDAAQECPLLYSANMSIGINLLATLVERASLALGPGFDIEILETHHRNKIDAPSGTALMLGNATGRVHADLDRSGKRETGTIGFAVQRGGDVVGEHTVSFFGPGERLELIHRAHDRSLFAKGALRAAQWIKNKPHGYYTMRDVLADE